MGAIFAQALTLTWTSAGDSQPINLERDKSYDDPECKGPHNPPLIQGGTFSGQQVARFRSEIAFCTAALNKHPNDSALLARRAMANLCLNRRKVAGADAEAALKANSSNKLAASITYTLAVLAHKDLEEEDELKYLNITLKAYPNESHLYRERGDLLHGLDREEEAMADQNKAIALNPKSNGAYQGRAQIESQQGKMDAAIKDFSRAIELYPYSITSIMAISQCYETEKKYPQAIQGYSKMLTLKVADPVDRLKAIARRAELYTKMGKTAEALKDYTTMIETPRAVFKTIERSNQFSSYSRALQGRADIYKSEKKYDLAIKDYTALIQFEKDWGDFEPKWYHERAALYRSIGKNELAAGDEKMAKR